MGSGAKCLPGFLRCGSGLSWRAYALLALLCLALYLPGLASLPPTDRDESLFAQASKQMIETQNYVDINFLGTPRYKKPIGIYWLQAAAVQLLSPKHLDQIWAYRVPSLLGAMLAVLMTAATGALLFNASAGLTAGIMMATCLDLIIEAHLAKTDAAMLGSIMVMQYALARAYVRPEAGWKNAFVFWSALGVGILLKGPISLLVLFSTLGWLGFNDKNLAWFKKLKPLAGLLYLIMLVAPWFVAINLASHGKFAQESAGHDFLAKIWQGQDRGHLPPGLHALVFPAVFFPFSLFALLGIPDVWRNRREREIRFLLGWLVPTWVVFELSLTKLPHYILPALPAIALLTAKFFLDGFPVLANLARRWWPTLVVCVWIFVGMAFAVVFAVLPYFVDQKIVPLQIASSAFLLIAQSVALLAYLQRRRGVCIAALAAGILVFSGIAFSVTLPSLNRMWIARSIVEQARAVSPCQEFRLVSAGFREPSLAFLAGSDTKLVPNGAFAASEMQQDFCRVGVINKPLLREFLGASYDAAVQPRPAEGLVEGFNTGRSTTIEMYFYVMPQSKPATPVYP